MCVFRVGREDHEKHSALFSSFGSQGGGDWVGDNALILEVHRAERLVLFDTTPLGVLVYEASFLFPQDTVRSCVDSWKPYCCQFLSQLLETVGLLM